MRSLLILAVLQALFILAHANSKPAFGEDLKKLLQEEGIPENTPKYKILGSIRCTDPDGDPIKYQIQDNTYLAVNEVTGEVSVNGNLDREESSNSQSGGNQPYSVRFQCSDTTPQGEIKTTIFADIIITVNDVNDQTPVFSTDSPTGFTFYVSESEQPGYKLNGTLTITDNDKEYKNVALQKVQLICTPPTSQETCKLFRVQHTQVGFGKYTVSLYLNGTLDYESEAAYTLGIIAEDGNTTVSNTGSTGILINVIDSQDTPPRFQNPVFFFSVDEGLPVGTPVNFLLSARDMDTTNPRPIAIEILPQNDGGPNFFRAGPATKEVSGIFSAPVIVNVLIDREQASDVYSFQAKATELDSSGNRTDATAVALVTVNIRDKNDNAPLFTQENYNVTIQEADQQDQQIITVARLQVNDLDRLVNARYQVEVVSQSFPGAFDILPKTPVEGFQGFNLQVNQFTLVDYEVPAYRSHIVVLRAVETETIERLSSSATVHITVTDVNDNKPVFQQERYETSVSENDNPGQSILTFSATDRDSGTNGQLFYRLSDQAINFTVDSTTGVLTLTGKVDFETKPVFIFLAYAVDRGVPPKSSQASVIIRVIDFNEGAPKFSSSQYTGQVIDGRHELGEVITKVEAIDETDASANITYRIIGGNTASNAFYMNPFSGELFLTQDVTLEMTPNRTGVFTLVIQATDNGVPPLSQTGFITVYVIAQNKASPVFEPRDYYKTISETVPPGTYLLTVSATDSDYGTNGKITYRIGTGSRDSFVVWENASVYISPVPNFDYDVLKNLTFLVIATDGGSPQHSATATIHVSITDSNNKKPVFSKRLYNKVIDEATAKGTSIMQVSATDLDTTSSLSYSIDINSIKALNKAAAAVESSFAYDLTGVFEINPQTGVISVARLGPGLDRNFAEEISFDIKVVDKAGIDQSDTSMVTIIITGHPKTDLYFNPDWTESNPVYVLRVSEATAVGMVIKTFQAHDPLDQTLVTDYRKIGGDDAEYFTLNSSSGEVKLTKPMDYEIPTQWRHTLIVAAVKEPTSNLPARTATATLSIELQDANDNPPIFTRQDYDFTIPEDVPLDYEVTRITAYDRDSPSFGPIEFYMGIGQDRNDFRLEKTGSPGTVRLLVNTQLDFERRFSYNLEIIAKDNSQEGASSSLRQESRTQVKISLTDVNDNSPVFADTKRTFSVPETAETDRSLGQVLAQDGDTGIFGDIVYSLELDSGNQQGVNPLNLFGITVSSGVLVTRQSLLGLSGLYKLKVFAKDRGNPPRMGSIPVEIRVQGVEDDDGTPKWESPDQFVTYVTEHNRTTLDIIIRAKARTPNASIEYSLASYGSDYESFRINRSSGALDVIKDLDREIQAIYKLVVEATDTLVPEKISRRELTVNLIDVNDNEPSFKKTKYAACPTDFEVPKVITVLDGTPNNTIVGTAKACDPDEERNARMFYYRYNEGICQYNSSDALEVNINGSIQSTRILDFEEKQSYLVCVEVKTSPDTHRRKREDYDVSKMTDTNRIAYIIIRIEDINDNGPKFPDKDVVAVLDSVPTEDSVTQVKADDADGDANDHTVYIIKNITFYPAIGSMPFSMKGSFSINPDNGVVSHNLPSYQDFAQGHFKLVVEAYDLQNRIFSDTVSVMVVIYQRSQILKMVLDQTPDQGEVVAKQMIMDLNEVGKDDGKQFFLIKASENSLNFKQTDVCLVVVEDQKAFDAGSGMAVLDSKGYWDVLKNYSMVDRGTCYRMMTTKENVEWRDLWWVLVAIAIFIFVCILILIITVCILYDKYKNYTETEKTYLVAH